MISRTKLLENLRIEIGSKVFDLLTNEFINKILYMRVLPRFSDWYPLLCKIRINKSCAVPFQNYNGKITNFAAYRIPDQFDVPWLDVNEEFRWRDIEDYNIGGNDTTDIYTGGNFILNNMFLSARSAMPHSRTYYMVSFQEPDLLIVDPPQQIHRDFSVTMQADRTLKTIPRNMERFFEDYFIAQMKFAIFQDLKYEDGTQTYAGVEIDTKISDLSEAKSEIKEIEEEFEKDYYKNPQRFQTICLYQNKS